MQPQGGAFFRIFPFIMMIALFYLLIYLPEKKRKKKYSSMLKSLKVNDEVITKGGTLGKIVNIEENIIIIQTGPDKVRIKMDINGILSVFNKKIEEQKKDKNKKEEKNLEASNKNNEEIKKEEN